MSGTAGIPVTPAHTPGDSRAFDTALRGYDRHQVDDFVAARRSEVARLTSDLGEALRQRKLATDHAEATEQELRELRARPTGAVAAPEAGFGFRAEKLLRMAEQEAAEVRSQAGKESAAIVEKARSEAEKHRHEAEQTLIARASLLEQQAAQRAAELQDREQQIADQLAASREQTEQMHAAAIRTAERLQQDSEAAAAETRIRAETAAARLRDQAAQEVSRLATVHSDVRAELARLSTVLSAELGQDVPTKRAALVAVPEQSSGAAHEEHAISARSSRH